MKNALARILYTLAHKVEGIRDDPSLPRAKRPQVPVDFYDEITPQEMEELKDPAWKKFLRMFIHE